jgi:hypothetical protein
MAPNLDVESGDETIHLTVSAGVPYRSYNDLTDLPKINNVQVKGDLSLADLGIESDVYIANVNYSNGTYTLAGSIDDLNSAYEKGKVCILQCKDKQQYAFLYKGMFYSGKSIWFEFTPTPKMHVTNFMINTANGNMMVTEYSYILTPEE